MEKFRKLLEKKRQMGKSLDGPERDAKLSAVQGMKDMANEAMKPGVHNLKKVTVASDSEEGVKAGLEKAHEMVGREGLAQLGKMGEDEKDDMGMADEDEGGYDEEFGASGEEDPAHESEESPEEEKSEDDEMSEEDLNKELERLMQLKKSRSK